MTLRTFLFTGLILASCGKSDKDTPPAAANAPAPTAATPTPAPTPTPPAAPAVADVAACSLLTAAEVGAIFGKTVVVVPNSSSLSCGYGFDPVEKQKQMDALTKGGVQGVADMAKAGGGFKIPTAISEQLVVSLDLAKDDQTEDQIKATLGTVSTAVNATKPDEHGLHDTVKTGKDIAGVGDWAFTTNVAAVAMPGVAMRGRMLEARKGPWHITVSVTIAPDPGEAKLDDELANLARGAIAKLK